MFFISSKKALFVLETFKFLYIQLPFNLSLSTLDLEDDSSFKVYNVSCLNKSLITQFVWYSRRKQDMTLKLCQLIEYYVGYIFIENHAEIMHRKRVWDPYLILVNNPKEPLHVRNCLKWDVLIEDCRKALKKITFFFRTQFLLINKIIKKKRNLNLGTSHSSSCKTSSDKFLD